MLAAAVLAFVALLLGLMLGDVPLHPADVVGALFGGDHRVIVANWRLPRALAAIVVGGSLGAAGAVFQSITRNPLGSPDIIGLTSGAYFGALLVITAGIGTTFAVELGAVVGGLATAGIVAALALGRGLFGHRLIIVGIGVSAVLTACTSWMLLRTDVDVALAAAVWGAGSLGGASWSAVLPALALLAPTTIALLATTRTLGVLELGDDAATALGVRVLRARLGVIALAVVLTALATAIAGPIAFVALAAPHLARAFVPPGWIWLVMSWLVGAGLLALADLLAQHAIPGRDVPVGIVALMLGGSYLIVLIVRRARRNLGGL